MRRRAFIKNVAFAAAFTALPMPHVLAGDEQTERPNIVVFLVDDMGLMDSSNPFLTDDNKRAKRYPWNDFFRTPNMEKLARKGVRFSNFYAHSVCSPTRVSLMTGQNSARHRTTNWIKPESNNGGVYGPPDWNWKGIGKTDPTIASMLRQNGYHTIHVGKAHFGPYGSYGEEPRNIGFDVNIAGCAHGRPGSYYAQDKYAGKRGSDKNYRRVPHLEAYWGSKTFLTEALTLEANKEIEKAVKNRKPFFLHMSHYALHAPMNSDPRFAANYSKSGKSKAVQAFATLVEGMDKSLGDILIKLEELGIAENTLIFFLGDNGSYCPEAGPGIGYEEIISCAPLRGKKGSRYEGGVRVPFIAAWVSPNPKHALQKKLPIPANVIQSQIGVVYDLFPTILNAVEVKQPAGHIVDGQDLRQLLTGRADSSREDKFLCHFPHVKLGQPPFTTLVMGDWKVIYLYKSSEKYKRYQLFNLKNDPSESCDLAVSRPEKLEEMMRALVRELENSKALLPVEKGTGEILKPLLPEKGVVKTCISN